MSEYLTPEELADLFRIDKKSVEDWLEEGNVPAIRIGNLWRISKAKLDNWLDSSMQIPQKKQPIMKVVVTPKSNITISEKYFTCEDIAEKYGVKKITVWSWIREKKLNAIQTGKNYRIRPEDLKEFEESKRTM